MKKKLTAILFVLLVVALFLVGCSSSGGGETGDGMPPAGKPGGIVTDEIARKIVYTVEMDLETDEVSFVRAALLASAAEAGGYVERQNDYGQSGDLSRSYIVLRIPTDRLEKFVDGAGERGKLLSMQVSSTDITTEYVSVSARKAALEERKTQLEAILVEEGLSVSDRISVIDNVSEVNAALQEIELQLSQYDSFVDFSTVRLNIYKTNIGAIVGVIVLVLFICGLVAGVIVLWVKYSVLRQKMRARQQSETPKS